MFNKLKKIRKNNKKYKTINFKKIIKNIIKIKNQKFLE